MIQEIKKYVCIFEIQILGMCLIVRSSVYAIRFLKVKRVFDTLVKRNL